MAVPDLFCLLNLFWNMWLYFMYLYIPKTTLIWSLSSPYSIITTSKVQHGGFLSGRAQGGVERLRETIYIYIGHMCSFVSRDVCPSVSLSISERGGFWWRGIPPSRNLEIEPALPHDHCLLFLTSIPLLPPLECSLSTSSQGCFLLVIWVSDQMLPPESSPKLHTMSLRARLLFFSSLYPQILEQCLAHRRHSINKYRID